MSFSSIGLTIYSGREFDWHSGGEQTGRELDWHSPKTTKKWYFFSTSQKKRPFFLRNFGHLTDIRTSVAKGKGGGQYVWGRGFDWSRECQYARRKRREVVMVVGCLSSRFFCGTNLNTCLLGSTGKYAKKNFGIAGIQAGRLIRREPPLWRKYSWYQGQYDTLSRIFSWLNIRIHTPEKTRFVLLTTAFCVKSSEEARWWVGWLGL